MGHGGHGELEGASDRRVLATIALNLLLTVGQIVGGALAGSIVLVADAMHNLNDALSLVNVLIARRFARRAPDYRRTFGYQRAEVVGGLINLVALVVVGLFLAYESIARFFQPRDVEAWVLIALGGLALAIDLLTVVLLYAMRKGSINLRAAFVHKVADALASVVVVAGGVLILLFEISWVDPLLSMLIVAYIFWQASRMLPEAIRVLMESVPRDFDLIRLTSSLRDVEGVEDVHHLHVWMLDEHDKALEAHLVVEREGSWQATEGVKREVKRLLHEEFEINHSTLEVEHQDAARAKSHDSSLIPGSHEPERGGDDS